MSATPISMGYVRGSVLIRSERISLQETVRPTSQKSFKIYKTLCRNTNNSSKIRMRKSNMDNCRAYKTQALSRADRDV